MSRVKELERQLAAVTASHKMMVEKLGEKCEQYVAERKYSEQMRALAKRLSNALLKIRPLGGSEMFIRMGDEFFADPDLCGKLIEEAKVELHLANVAMARAAKQPVTT